MIQGWDLSKWDSVSDVQPEFVILNVEDPGCPEKAHAAHGGGIIWGLYSWVYPGDNGYSATRSKAMGDLLELDGIGQPPAGHWLDYEQEGVTPSDLLNAFGHGVGHLGVYTYLDIVPTIAVGVLGDHPLWIAYYPGANDGTYPAGSIGDAQKWGAKLWQYSSTGGTLDRDVVVDEAWWSVWVGASHPQVRTFGEPGPMILLVQSDGMFVQAGAYYMNGVDVFRPVESVNDYPQPFPVGNVTGHAADLIWTEAIAAQKRNAKIDALADPDPPVPPPLSETQRAVLTDATVALHGVADALGQLSAQL